MYGRHLGIWSLAILLLGNLTAAQAIPFIVESRVTFRQKVDQADLVVYARLIKGGGGDGTEGTAIIQDVIKGHPILGKQKALPLGQGGITLEKGSYPPCVLFGEVVKGKVFFYSSDPFNPPDVGYLKGLLALKPEDRVGQLRYCFRFLEHENVWISRDAHQEFADGTDAEISQVAAQVSAEKLRVWLQEEQTDPSHLGLYALMLGHCGIDQDAGLLRQLLEKEVKKSSPTGVDRLLIGYTLLRPKEGWAYIRELLKNPQMDFLVRYGGFRAARFFHTPQRKVLTRKDILEVVALLLDQADMADLAIWDLRKWGYWDFTPRILALWGRPLGEKTDTRAARFVAEQRRRCILCYALCCPDPQAARFVAEQRRQNPQMVEDVEEWLREYKAFPPPEN